MEVTDTVCCSSIDALAGRGSAAGYYARREGDEDGEGGPHCAVEEIEA
jgi:hypothetical protein